MDTLSTKAAEVVTAHENHQPIISLNNSSTSASIKLIMQGRWRRLDSFNSHHHLFKLAENSWR